MLVFILADAHLELIPRRLWKHPSVKKWCRVRGRKPWELMLDQTLIFSAIKNDEELRDRGRVDILHRALLLILDSSLCARGIISDIVVHTKRGNVYSIHPDTRLPRHYFRFLGLMEKLLVEGAIFASGKKLIAKCSNLREVLEKNNVKYVIGLSRRGRREKLEDYLRVKLKQYKRIAFVVGAFPSGYFSDDVEEIIDDKKSL